MFDITLPKIAKNSRKLKRRKYKFLTAFFAVFIVFSSSESYCQTLDSTTSVSPQDTNFVPADTSASTPKKAKNSNLEHPINYSSQDSMWFDIKTSTIILYGDAHVDYGNISLDADIIGINWNTQTVTATYSTDSTGKKKGIPYFKYGKDEYQADSMAYNFDTEKAYIVNVLKEQDGNWLSGERGYKDAENNMYIEDAAFCPCEDPEASTYIKTKKLKVIPEKRVYAGPALLHIGNIPTPLGLPFGIFPVTGKRTSGIILPNFDYQGERGYSLTDFGYYWAMNDYVGIKLLGSVFSKGGGGFGVATNYRKRYSFSGNVNFNYNRIIARGDEYSPSITNDFSLQWSHRPVARNGRSLTANVDIRSTRHNQRYEFDPNERIKSVTNSSISYTMPINGTPFSTSVNLRHNQNNQTGIYNFTLPSFNLNMRRVYPLRNNGRTKDYNSESINILRDFYQSTSFSFNSNLQNVVTNGPRSSASQLPFEISNFAQNSFDTLALNGENFSEIWDRNTTSITYSVPLQATLKLAKGKIALEPRFNYNGYIYPERFSYTRDSLRYSEEDSLISNGEEYYEAFSMDTTRGFNHAFNYSTQIQATTNLYGIYGFKNSNYPRFLHTIRPSVGLRFSPDFSNQEVYPSNYTNVYSLENDTTYAVSPYLGYSDPRTRKQSSLTFSIDNILEMKNKGKKELSDTSDEKITVEPKRIIDNIGAKSSYNFAAEEFELQPFQITARSSALFNGLLAITYSGTLDPYYHQFDTSATNNDTRINQYAWQRGQGLGTFSSHTLNASTSINPNTIKDIFGIKEDTIKKENYGYRNFRAPWSLSFNYVYRISRLGYDTLGNTLNNKTQSLSINGSLKLTPNWSVSANTNYDIIDKEFLNSNINIARDLGCWEMRLQWYPFGSQQGFRFNINIKSSMLSDKLKYEQKRYGAYN